MSVEWSDWIDTTAGPAGSPYVNWGAIVDDGQDVTQPMTATPMTAENFAALQQHFGENIPLPSGVGPNEDQIVENGDMVLPDLAAKLPFDNLQKDDVIMAVIDDSIAPGHVRFRDQNGDTRIHWFWNMGAQFGTQAKDITKPPFGREFFRSDLNPLDEMTANQSTEVVDFGRVDGARGTAMRASHGTHMLDLAAGHRVGETDDDIARLPILAVNLPNRTVRDTSGHFLEFFIVNAIQRVMDVADAMWAQKFGNDVNPDGDIGFRMVINISFGFTAGPKNGQQILDRYIQNLNRDRMIGAPARSTPQIFFPAGNDYLSRTIAKLSVGPMLGENAASVDWRMVPDDHTSSYMEIWFDEQDIDAPFPEISVGLAPPGQSVALGETVKFGQSRDLLSNGQIIGQMTSHRLPCRDADGVVTDIIRPWIHIAMAPTYNDENADQFVPAGAWKLGVANADTTSINMDLAIQRDDTIRAGRTAGRQSYFDHAGFDMVDDFGRLDLTDGDSVIKQSGTINALACLPRAVTNVNVIGAFDKTTMKLAKYSSAGPGFFGDINQGRASFDYAAPGDTSPVRSGILAAGSASGGAATWSGTSVACAIAAGSYARDLMSDTVSVGGLMLDRQGLGTIAELSYYAQIEMRTVER